MTLSSTNLFANMTITTEFHEWRLYLEIEPARKTSDDINVDSVRELL